jgi:hypothetical protein
MSDMKYTTDLRRSRIEVATVTVEAEDAAGARIAIEGMVREGRVPKGKWHEESIGAIMIGSPRRDEP